MTPYEAALHLCRRAMVPCTTSRFLADSVMRRRVIDSARRCDYQAAKTVEAIGVIEKYLQEGSDDA